MIMWQYLGEPREFANFGTLEAGDIVETDILPHPWGGPEAGLASQEFALVTDTDTVDFRRIKYGPSKIETGE